MTHNQIDYAKHKENVRHNRRSEKQTDKSIAESIRHNKRSEQLGQANVDLGYANVGLGYSNLGELYRHNAQTEIISQQQVNEAVRHNVATEKNQSEANVAKVASNPTGYLVYQATKYAPIIVDKIVEGFNNFADASKAKIKSSASMHLDSAGAK